MKQCDETDVITTCVKLTKMITCLNFEYKNKNIKHYQKFDQFLPHLTAK